MSETPLFKNNRDRTDFIIALAVIAFFLWLFLFSGLLGKKSLDFKNMSLTDKAYVDTDNDGVWDRDDACTHVYGTGKNGCPIDTDGDGLYDHQDECPTLRGKMKYKGCPSPKIIEKERIITRTKVVDEVSIDQKVRNTVIAAPAVIKKNVVVDTDKDGITDDLDKCPKKYGKGVDGCPVDSDGDGILDQKDRCPKVAGVKENGGCPKLKLEEAETKVVKEEIKNIRFEYGKGSLHPSSYPILDKVAAIMNKYKSARLGIAGHTDNDSSSEFNLKLSQQRAVSCRKYLIEKGIAPSRILAKGYGETRPIASNDTEEGRKQNRRVEFILK